MKQRVKHDKKCLFSIMLKRMLSFNYEADKNLESLERQASEHACGERCLDSISRDEKTCPLWVVLFPWLGSWTVIEKEN